MVLGGYIKFQENGSRLSGKVAPCQTQVEIAAPANSLFRAAFVRGELAVYGTCSKPLAKKVNFKSEEFSGSNPLPCKDTFSCSAPRSNELNLLLIIYFKFPNGESTF